MSGSPGSDPVPPPPPPPADDEPDQFLEAIRNKAGRGKRKLDASSQGSASEPAPASKYQGETRLHTC